MTAAMHSYAEAAVLLRCSASWLQKRIDELPHLKIGSRVWFTDEHIEEIKSASEVRPVVAEVPRPSVVRVGPVPYNGRPTRLITEETPTKATA